MPAETSIQILYLNIPDGTGDGLTILPEEVRSVRSDLYPLAGRAQMIHLLGRWLVSKLLKDRTPDPIGAVVSSSFGKPSIPGTVSFNISHSKDLIVCAAAMHGEIGIDVEYKCPLDWQQYQDSFSSPEWIKISSDRDPASAFLERWTKKESLVKADGRGLRIPLQTVTLFERYGTIGTEQRKWYIVPVSFDGYFCHVSTEFPVAKIFLEEARILDA
jgi:4'-phosphopantetheinyl transferase